MSKHSRMSKSPIGSDAEIHPSSGVPVVSMPSTKLKQSNTFPQLASHKGIEKWNSSVFDERWLLKPEEMWDVSVDTVSPDRQRLNYGYPDIDHHTEASRNIAFQEAHIDRLSRELEKSKSQQPIKTPWVERETPDTLAAYTRLVGIHESNQSV